MHELVCTNGAAKAEPDKVFRLLIANVENEAPRVLKGQVAASAIARSPLQAASTLTTKRVLGLFENNQLQKRLTEPKRPTCPTFGHPNERVNGLIGYCATMGLTFFFKYFT